MNKRGRESESTENNDMQILYLENKSQEKILLDLINSKKNPFINLQDEEDEYNDNLPEISKSEENPLSQSNELALTNTELNLIDTYEPELSEFNNEKQLTLINLFRLEIDPNRIYTDKTYRRNQYLHEYNHVLEWLNNMFVKSTPEKTNPISFRVDGLKRNENASVFEFLGSDQPIIYFTISVVKDPWLILINDDTSGFARWNLALHNFIPSATVIGTINASEEIKPLLIPSSDSETLKFNWDSIAIRKAIKENHISDRSRIYFWIRYDFRGVRPTITEIDPHHKEALSRHKDVLPIINSRKNDELEKEKKKKKPVAAEIKKTPDVVPMEIDQVENIIPKEPLKPEEVYELFSEGLNVFFNTLQHKAKHKQFDQNLCFMDKISLLLKEEKELRVGCVQWSINTCTNSNSLTPLQDILDDFHLIPKESQLNTKIFDVKQIKSLQTDDDGIFTELYNCSAQFLINLLTSFAYYSAKQSVNTFFKSKDQRTISTCAEFETYLIRCFFKALSNFTSLNQPTSSASQISPFYGENLLKFVSSVVEEINPNIDTWNVLLKFQKIRNLNSLKLSSPLTGREGLTVNHIKMTPDILEQIRVKSETEDKTGVYYLGSKSDEIKKTGSKILEHALIIKNEYLNNFMILTEKEAEDVTSITQLLKIFSIERPLIDSSLEKAYNDRGEIPQQEDTVANFWDYLLKRNSDEYPSWIETTCTAFVELFLETLRYFICIYSQ